MRTLMVICLLMVGLGLASAKPRPLFIDELMDVEENDNWMAHSKSRTRRQAQYTGFKESQQQLELLRVRMNDIDEDLRPCDETDLTKGVQCIEEDKCITWNQVCDEIQDCGIPQLADCLNQTVKNYGSEREELCNGDENRKWCDLKQHLPRRCGEDIDMSDMTNKSVRIVSPNYPRPYPSDMYCYWQVKTTEGNRLAVSVTKFDTESDYDFFSLGKGEKEDEEEPTRYLIYKHSGPDMPQPRAFRVDSDTIWMTFKSDDWDNFSGFDITVADTSVFDPGNVAQSPFPDAKNKSCGGTIRLDVDSEQEITSPGYPEPYGNYMECDWVIRIVRGRRIGISFQSFDLETNQDFVEIGTGGTPGSNEAPSRPEVRSDYFTGGGKLTGRNPSSKPIVIDNNQAWMRFTSDPANAWRGFRAIVRDQPYTGCGGSIDVPEDGSIVVASPLFPDLGYRINLNCIWKFTGAPGRQLSVIFKEFATEKIYDTVSAGYGGGPANDGSNYVIDDHSGNELPDPVGFDTPQNEAWVYFRSDASVIDRGFKVEVSDTSIRPANFTPETRPTQEPDTNCGGEVEAAVGSTKLVINSPRAGSKYRKLLDCLWEIEVPFSGKVRISFSQFQTEKNRDVIKVGNGTDPDEGEPFLVHSGRQKPEDIITTAHNLWVRFITDYDYELSGWTMVIETLPYNNCSGHLHILPEGGITIGSPNYPYNYNNGETCYYQIIGAPGKRIELQFLMFNTEPGNDILSIGEGCIMQGGDIIVDEYSGHNRPMQDQSQGRYFSRTNAVWMIFNTTDYSDYAGWLINFKDAMTPADDSPVCPIFVPPTRPPPTTKAPYTVPIYSEDTNFSGDNFLPDWYNDLTDTQNENQDADFEDTPVGSGAYALPPKPYHP
ncbi:cubilin-like [Lytechinus variegatus]|uniref:cubilin-like n=1 Tax=Lytechinus variegatus TaxID=7654 RepID=UPI001BB275B1|nr:cubilin-like [Lytechinus variegatus]